MRQKKTYIRPEILTVSPMYHTNLLNGGSVRTQGGGLYGQIQPGTGGGTSGAGGFIDGDAKIYDSSYSIWDE